MTESLKAKLERFIRYSQALEEELKQLYKEKLNAENRCRVGGDNSQESEKNMLSD